ncbi:MULTISPECIES: hypothetical protein [Paraliobacillus]|uniref:hypothetical protein n=1 Tax=Paraliobacillus TaxID=200903 RepID=UPI000DD4651E|nr:MULTISPECIES: hypothetical protein [Paraliobacillus]
MKFIKRFVLTLFILGLVGYGVYYFGMNYLANKVVTEVDAQLTDEDREEVRAYVESVPTLKGYIEEAPSIDETSLPFTTKEEAAKQLVKKFSVSEIQNIQAAFQTGMSQAEQQVLISELENKLTPEELDALKVIVYKELYQKN